MWDELSPNYPHVPFASKSGGHVPQLLWERRPWLQNARPNSQRDYNFDIFTVKRINVLYSVFSLPGRRVWFKSHTPMHSCYYAFVCYLLKSHLSTYRPTRCPHYLTEWTAQRSTVKNIPGAMEWRHFGDKRNRLRVRHVCTDTVTPIGNTRPIITTLSLSCKSKKNMTSIRV